MKFDPSLYLVLDPTLMRDRDVEALLSAAVAGGVSLVQVREKNCSKLEFLNLATRCAKVLRPLCVPLIVNDRLDVALAVGAQGLHIGQSDVHWAEARRQLGPEAILGLSVENFAQAALAESAEVDYLGVSSVFPTASKKDVREIWTLEGLRRLRSRHPLVGIGGIDRENAAEVIAAGAAGVAVVSALCGADHVREEAALLLERINTARSTP